MNDSAQASEGLLAQAHKAGQEHAPTDHHQKGHSAGGLLHESRAAGQEAHGREEQQAAIKLPTETFEEFIIRSRQESSDDESPARGRSLPDEEKEQGRGR